MATTDDAKATKAKATKAEATTDDAKATKATEGVGACKARGTHSYKWIKDLDGTPASRGANQRCVDCRCERTSNNLA